MMIMFKSIKIYDVSLANISLSPRLKARDSWQVEIFTFTTLSNIRQTEVVFSNDPFVQGVYVPVISFSSNLRACILVLCLSSLYWPHSFTSQI